jgi:adenine-specific DNA-methyltransferase
MKKAIEQLNKTKNKKGLICNNYCPTESGRMFFTDENGQKIDGIRKRIENTFKHNKITKDEYIFLIACLLVSADKVANIASVYGCYLKKFKNSALKKIIIEPIHTLNNSSNLNIIYNEDILNLKDKFDIVYLDPPYNQRQYSKNYHILNYIALYSENIKIYGKTGLLENSSISKFCSSKDIYNAIDSMIKIIKTKYLFMSYSNEGLISIDKIKKILSKYDYKRIKIIKREYKKFKAYKYNKSGQTIEYLICAEFTNK